MASSQSTQTEQNIVTESDLTDYESVDLPELMDYESVDHQPMDYELAVEAGVEVAAADETSGRPDCSS